MRKTAKRFGVATVAASGLAATLIGLAPASQAAPSGTSNARQTISQLQSQGYHVIVNRIGATPIDKAVVVAVRPGTNFTRTDSLNTGVTQKTVYVDVK